MFRTGEFPPSQQFSSALARGTLDHFPPVPSLSVRTENRSRVFILLSTFSALTLLHFDC